MWKVYIIESELGKLYTGITTDLDRRMKEHTNLKKGAKFFRFSKPKKIIFQEKAENRSLATKRESEIKKMNRKKKLELIAERNEKISII